MGLTQSHVDQAIARPGPPPSSPRPSSSPLNPPRPSFLSYFIPTPTLDLTHDHLPPSLSDITEVADILARLLPPELVPRILDEAEYWTACRRMTKKHVTVTARAPSPREMLLQWRNGQEEELREAREVAGSGLKDGLGEVWYLVSPPIGCTQRPESPLVQQPQPESRNLSTEAGEGDVGGVEQEGPTKVWLRRVVLETLSKDQGWSTNDSAHTHYGTYEQSYSWFELSLLRDGKEVPNSRHVLQYNVHAGQYFKAHSNAVEPDHPLLQAARPGDRIALWARAQYQGWTNNVQEAAITVFTAPWPPER